VRGFELLALTGRPALTSEFALALGGEGMIGGQVADLVAEGRQVTREDVVYIHVRKTAALFRACARAGGILADASPAQLQALSRYGEELGLAFQIKDDLLDLEGTTDRLGKTARADVRKAKATYPRATSVEEARAEAVACAARASTCLEGLGSTSLVHAAGGLRPCASG
jgi:geranylgeranyl pyrophosphate synthase